MSEPLILHNFFRSSTSTRLRAALNLKGLAYDYVGYALKAGDAETPAYLRLNPQGLVPSLELADGTVLIQSLAIMEWLEERYPEPALLPPDPLQRARVRALAGAIALDIHPLNNLRVLGYLKDRLGADENAVADWFRHWVDTTFAPLEQMLATSPATGLFCHGDTPGYADCCLYAQVWNNRRFAVDMSRYPVISRIFEACDGIDAFTRAAPMNQPDAVA
ncbi:MAG: maleylacetoacetate isomerase [Gammaproteobacteria bacterium]|nr:maleylacetoacetate isomerase [Gammaproteobacteria bacterium]MDH3536600.1 maleylacetoacetate isomerase [Gammaproteobacteria bacterium]